MLPSGMSTAEQDLKYRLSSASTDNMPYSTPSLLTSALPSSIQSRLPFISSIRKTVASQITSFRLEGATTSCSQATTLEVEETIENRPQPQRGFEEQELPPTPPPEDSHCTASHERSLPEAMLRQDPRQSKRRSLEYPCRSNGGGTVGMSMKSASGVDWKYGSHGLRFLEMSMAEAALKDMAYETDPDFERRAYIDGVIYALKGLPSNLDDADVLALRRSSPDRVKLLGISPSTPANQSDDKRPLPQRLTQWLVVRIFILLSYVVPTITFLLEIYVQLDRKYKIPERVVTSSMWLAGKVHRRTLGAYLAFCSLDDGRLGQAMGDSCAYLLDSVARGVRDGFSEGVGVLKKES